MAIGYNRIKITIKEGDHSFSSIYTIDEFLKYINLKTTNGKENDIELERNVRDLYNYFNKLLF